MNLLSFNGQLDGSSAWLKWSTGSEVNARNFDIQKSVDGTSFYTIGSVKATGNSNTQKDYTFRDEQLGEMNYYRLKMNDLDGKSRNSQVVLIRYTLPKQNIWIVNNPFTQYIDLRFAKQPGNVKLQLVNASGAVVAERSFTALSTQLRWDISQNLGRGTYVLRSFVDGKLFSNKLVKQ